MSLISRLRSVTAVVACCLLEAWIAWSLVQEPIGRERVRFAFAFLVALVFVITLAFGPVRRRRTERRRALVVLPLATTAGLVAFALGVSAANRMADVARVGLALVSVLLADAVARECAAVRDAGVPDAERARHTVRCAYFMTAFVIVATTWTTGLAWPGLPVGATLVLVAGLLTTSA